MNADGGIPAAPLGVMMMRWSSMALAALALSGCCTDKEVSKTAYAAMASYGPQLAACIGGRACRPLCAAVFSLDDDQIISCQIMSLQEQPISQPVLRKTPFAAVSASATTTSATSTTTVVGANVQVVYLEASCPDGEVAITVDDGDSGSDDCDDGSCDDAGDDGSTDSGDDGSGDDGSGGGDGGGDSGGGDGTIIHPGHSHQPARVHRPIAWSGATAPVRPR